MFFSLRWTLHGLLIASSAISSEASCWFPEVSHSGGRVVEVGSIISALLGGGGADGPTGADALGLGGDCAGLTPLLGILVTPEDREGGGHSPPEPGWLVSAGGRALGHLPARPGRYLYRLAAGDEAASWRLEAGAHGPRLSAHVQLWPPSDWPPPGESAADWAPPMQVELGFERQQIEACLLQQVRHLLDLRQKLRASIGRLHGAMAHACTCRAASYVPDSLEPGELDGCLAELEQARELALEVPLRWLTPRLMRQLGELRHAQEALGPASLAMQRGEDVAAVLMGIYARLPVAEAAEQVDILLRERESPGEAG